MAEYINLEAVKNAFNGQMRLHPDDKDEVLNYLSGVMQRIKSIPIVDIQVSTPLPELPGVGK